MSHESLGHWFEYHRRRDFGSKPVIANCAPPRRDGSATATTTTAAAAAAAQTRSRPIGSSRAAPVKRTTGFG